MADNNWKVATLISSEMVASDVKSLKFEIPNFSEFKSGQHCAIRLTAEDGYIAERDYSIASSPEEKSFIEFGIQLLREGEVSPYLFDLKAGEKIEIEGPIGKHFIWETDNDQPLLLIGGGSGMVPLRSMILHHFNNFKPRDVVFLTSCKSIDKVLYQFELEKLAEKYPDFKFIMTLTDTQPENYMGYKRRIDKGMLQEIFEKYKNENPNIYICGPTPFVEVAANIMLELGFNRENIRTERFGG